VLHKGLNKIGTVQLDIAFGGSFFAIVNLSDLKIVVDLQNKQEILKYAKNIRDYINVILMFNTRCRSQQFR